MDRLLSVHDVSGLTGWSPLTIYKKAAAGMIPGRLIIGKRSLRFEESEVRKWLASLKRSHSATGNLNEHS